jgi:hypothetical protein
MGCLSNSGITFYARVAFLVCLNSAKYYNVGMKTYIFALLFVTIYLCYQPVFASEIKGDYIKVDGLDGPPSVCKINIKGATACTGTLIAPEYIVTAAHCAEGLEKVDFKIYCGYRYKGAKDFYEEFKVTNIKYSPDYDKLGTMTAFEYDIAVMKLNKKSSIEPMKVIDSWDELGKSFKGKKARKGSDRAYDINLGEVLNCNVSGFGEDNSEFIGKLNTSRSSAYFSITKDGLIKTNPQPIKGKREGDYIAAERGESERFAKDQELGNKTGHGDSGGSFYCQNPQNNTSTLVGVIHNKVFFAFTGSPIFKKIFKDIQNEK